jgi:hypothetical protein
MLQNVDGFNTVCLGLLNIAQKTTALKDYYVQNPQQNEKVNCGVDDIRRI